MFDIIGDVHGQYDKLVALLEHLGYEKTGARRSTFGQSDEGDLTIMGTSEPAYVLGHTDRELVRLKTQARMIAPATRQFFCEAGIEAGMRVLDVGSGAGDVALLTAELVGASGEVIGTDKSATAVAAATRRTRAIGLPNVSFREGDPGELEFDKKFDAVVGRYVLLFQADAPALVRRVARHVRPGGVVVFHEPDWTVARSIPPAPTYDQCCAWIQDAFRLSGTDSNMAARLFVAFVDAGLAAPAMRMQTYIAGGAASTDFLRAVADLTGSLIPVLDRLSVASTSEVRWETLAERLIEEVEVNRSVVIGRSEIGAWARV